MKFTLSWLKEHLETDATLEQILDRLTALGLEVEDVVNRGEALADFKVAKITEAKPHPDADKLQVCKVDDGNESLQIVCGAPNARAGLTVCLAPVGVRIPANDLKIKPVEIRGVKSNGMLCSAAEIGLGEDAAGIMELDEQLQAGASFPEATGLDDPIIEIAITPNRGDCLGVYGIARDLAASGLGALKPLPKTHIQATGKSPIEVSIAYTEGCSLFLGRYIQGVKNGPSPKWLKDRLEAVGAKSISALVDVTNYMSLTYGRPAHVFDADKLTGDIVVRSAKAGETYTGLDEEEYTLADGMVVVADDKGTQALAGILGGMDSGSFDDTTNVFLEIAQFDPIKVALAGRELQIDSDARYRFERSVDHGFAETSMELATQMILELCGGEASEVVIAGNSEAELRTLTFRPQRIKDVLGVEIAEQEVSDYLQRLGFGVETADQSWKLTIPSWRADIAIEEDIIEEVARLHGYDAIPTEPLPPVILKQTSLSPSQRKRFDVSRVLAGRGLKEAVTFSFVSSEEARRFAENDNVPLLANPISSELDALRPSALPHLLSAQQRNHARGLSDEALFEIGPVFSSHQPGKQQRVASGLRAGKAAKASPLTQERVVDVFDAKADSLAVLGQYVATDNVQVTREAPGYYHPARSGALTLGKQVLGYFGELHPAIVKQYDLEHAVAFEVFMDNAPMPKARKSTARPLYNPSNLQRVKRDFAFLVDAQREAQEIVRALKKVDKNLIQSVHLFDVYSGEHVQAGKKSVAFTVTIQPTKETLNDEAINALSDKIITAVTESTGGILRDGR